MIRYLFIIVLVILGGIAFFFVQWGMPDFKRGTLMSTKDLPFPIIYQDRYGNEIYRDFSNENREWVELEKISPLLREATLIAEDRRFNEHIGIDFVGVGRAVLTNFKSGGLSQGGSTLTQQLSRKLFLTDEKTFERKFREMFISLGIEWNHSKGEILEMYLNTVPYGPRINGVGLASRFYFGKEPNSLSEAESLVLAVLPQRPIGLSRKQHVKDWLSGDSNSRIERILDEMRVANQWSDSKILQIKNEMAQIVLPQEQDWVADDYFHFHHYMRSYLNNSGVNLDYDKGLIIRTSLDTKLQRQIQQYMSRPDVIGYLEESFGMTNFSIIILDHETRSPMVWIGSRDYSNDDILGKVDILSSKRQVGSTIKPFVYAAAINQGYQPPTIFYDSDTSFLDGTQLARNSDGGYLGRIRMTQALAQSRNIPAIKALVLAGGEARVRKYLDSAFNFGINENYPDLDFGSSLALGTVPIELKDLANGYATIGSGVRKDICPILDITDGQGEPIQSPCDSSVKHVMSKATSFFIADILSNISARPVVVDWRKNLTIEGQNLAVKTGTSSGRNRRTNELYPVDNVIAGFSPKATVVMWGGNTDGTPLKSGTLSVIAIGPFWKKITEMFLAEHPDLHDEFEVPEYMQLIHGEWATQNYRNPGYSPLSTVFKNNYEANVNPFNGVRGERIFRK